MLEQLEKGLTDFGIVFGAVDHSKYHSIPLPYKDIWGVPMRKDSPLAAKGSISPNDLWDKPLMISILSERGAERKNMSLERAHTKYRKTG